LLARLLLQLTYGAFSRFVKAREAGLRQAFSLFDTGESPWPL
jgi:hypothetical protein